MSQLLDISDEELVQDMVETINEIRAYHQLADGFFILSNLSNISEFKKRQYFWEYTKYKEFESEADSFLYQLFDLQYQRTDKS